MWRIDAEWFPEKNDKPTKPTKFSMSASVAEDVKVAGKDCWLLVIGPNYDLPDDVDFVPHFSIDKATGWPVKAVEVNSEWEGKFTSFGKLGVLDKPLPFFPAEIFGIPEPGEYLNGMQKLVVTRERIGSETKVGVALFEINTEQWRISQTWKDGELFWNTYERHIKGRLALKATARVSSLAKRTDAEKKALGMVDPPVAKKPPLDPLRQDKRLWVPVKVEPARPSLAHMVEKIKEATGLDIEIGPELVGHAPDYGWLEPGFAAVELMSIMAKIEIKNARWDKTATGYRLHGTSTAPAGRVLVFAGSKHVPTPPKVEPTQPKVAPSADPPPEPLPQPFPWLLASGGVLAVIVIAAAVLVTVRRRSVGPSKPAGKAVSGKSST